jgi:hypothetical protein
MLNMGTREYIYKFKSLDFYIHLKKGNNNIWQQDIKHEQQ